MHLTVECTRWLADFLHRWMDGWMDCIATDLHSIGAFSTRLKPIHIHLCFGLASARYGMLSLSLPQPFPTCFVLPCPCLVFSDPWPSSPPSPPPFPLVFQILVPSSHSLLFARISDLYQSSSLNSNKRHIDISLSPNSSQSLLTSSKQR